MKQININDGNGLWDKYGLLRSCRNDLCGLRIRADEMSTTGVLIVDIINRLDVLIEGLQKDDDRYKQELEQARGQFVTQKEESKTEIVKNHEGDEVWWKK